MSQARSNRSAEQGFVSIVIALTVVIVLALITVAFAQFTRREQQNALNKQLATQATYAAESGINDAIARLNNPNDPGDLAHTGIDSCTPVNIDSTIGVSYPCLLVDIAPTSLVYSNVGKGSDRTVVFSTSAPLKDLKIEWGSASSPQKTPYNGNIDVTSTPQFKPQVGWNYPAVIQLMITPFDSPPAYATNRSSLMTNAFTVYLHPSTDGPNNVVYTPGNPSPAQGAVLSGKPCNGGTYQCNSVLNMPSLSAGTKYLVHFVNYYDPSNIKLTGVDATGATVKFLGGQATIDSTGKARDVLKRLQVRVPLGNDSPSVNYAIEAQNICKQFTADPEGVGTNPAGC